ncbi:MAG TPA: response regulator transcription factor, partial [Acidimicrobiales bacterium]
GRRGSAVAGKRPGTGSAIRVLIVSDRDIVRAGLAAVLRPYQGRVVVTGEGAGLDDAGTASARSLADVVIFDAHLASGDGLDEVDQLVEAWGGHHVVVVASPGDARFALPVLERGAAGFLLLSIAGDELVRQLESVRDESIVMDPVLGGSTGQLDRRDLAVWPGSDLGLTRPQSRVLELLAHGDRTTTVAGQLGMSEVEVKRHVRSAYRRLDVSDRSHALARLAEAGVFR